MITFEERVMEQVLEGERASGRYSASARSEASAFAGAHAKHWLLAALPNGAHRSVEPPANASAESERNLGLHWR